MRDLERGNTAIAAAPPRETFLSQAEIFRELATADLEALEKESQVLESAAGHIFFQPGEPGRRLFVLEKGRAQTFRTARGKKLIIAELEPPGIFGEMGCVGQRLYHCFARASEACRVRVISLEQMELLQARHPEVTRRLLDLVSRRFVEVLLDLESTAFRQLIPRVAKLLLEREEEGSMRGLTHREIAEHLRVYRESATAALGELRRAGIIGVGRKRIKVLDRTRLERAARE